VAPASDPGSERAAAEGWAALAEARWEVARACFEKALVRGETPEAHEGLSWAAWWLDDADAVFSARESAYRLYRDAGDLAAAARMATWLAGDQLDFHGARAVAQGWFARARRLLEGLPPGPEVGWLDFHEGFVAHTRGESAEARDRASSAAEIGRRFGVPDLEMLGLALEGASLVSAAQVAEGMRCLDEATATALEGDAEIPISGAWSCCFLVSACSAVLDWERAAEWCDLIREFAERYGSRYMLAFCRAEYGSVLLWRGRWPEAEEHFAAAVDDYTNSRPAWAGGPLVGLAELRRREGRRTEAATLLDDAGPSGAEIVCRARIALDGGDQRTAVDLAERALRKLPGARRLDRAPALDVLAHAATAGGDFDSAAAALAELGEIAEAAGTDLLHAQVEAASGTLEAARGKHAQARRFLEDALDGFERGGAPYESITTRLELASSLGALGRSDEANAVAAAAFDGARSLGAAGLAERAQALRASLGGAGDGARAEVTRREEDVLRLLADGLTNKQIAERLVVSEHTVHRHVANILRKLGLQSRSAAAAYAVRTGLTGQVR
jgi:LuxR family transcriptional regulator, maltose regulon positive regulatory protein